VRQSLLKNWGWKLLSLGVAAAIWAMVSNEPELGAFVTVPVQYARLPEPLEISAHPPEAVSLELRGPSGTLGEFSKSPAAVVLDLSGARPGERTFLVGPASLSLPRGVRLVRAIPGQLRLEFEPRASKTVPVRARFSRSLAPGDELASYDLRPGALSITGPRSRVEQVEEAETDPIDLSGVTGRAELRVNAYVGDPQVRFVGDSRVRATVVVRKK